MGDAETERDAAGIYAVTNITTGVRYIGSSEHLAIRWAAHRDLLARGRHHCMPLQRAWDADGAEAFRFDTLEYCDVAALKAREQHYILACAPTYNTKRAHRSAVVKMTLELPEELADDLDAAASKWGVTRTSIVERAVRRCPEIASDGAVKD